MPKIPISAQISSLSFHSKNTTTKTTNKFAENTSNNLVKHTIVVQRRTLSFIDKMYVIDIRMYDNRNLHKLTQSVCHLIRPFFCVILLAIHDCLSKQLANSWQKKNEKKNFFSVK